MTGNQEKFQQFMNKGHSAAWDQMWDRAAGYYRQALEELPDNPQALSNLGLALVELQEYEDALECYKKAAQVQTEDPLPLEKIAQLSERLGDLDQALQASLQAAELYLKNRDVSKAIENWEHVIQLNPYNLRAHSRLALVYTRIDEKYKAVSEYLALASIYQEAGKNEKALDSVNQALRVLPQNKEAIQARELLKDFKQLPKPARPPGGTAPLRMSQVVKLQAPKLADQPKLDPVEEAVQMALTYLAGMLFEAMDDERAGKADRRGLQDIVTGTGRLRKPVDRTRMMLHLSQVVDSQTSGDTNQATEELQRAMDAGLEHPAAYYDLGYLYTRAGRLESAMRHLQRSVKHGDFALGTRLLFGELLQKKNQIKDASLQYLEALKLADAQMVPAEKANDLLQLYEPIIESLRHESDPDVHSRICDNIHGMLMHTDWRDQLRRAREQLPEDDTGPAIPIAEILAEARSSRVIDSISSINELVKNDRLHSAMEDAFFALDHAPFYLPLHIVMGDMLVKEGNVESAVKKYQVIARTYSTRGDAQQAINLYRKVVALEPGDFTARGKLIDQLVAIGQIDEAIDEYIHLAQVHYNLADLNKARKTYTEALRTAQSANMDRELRVNLMHHMADIDLQSLDWRQALRIFEQIRTLQPDDEKARTNLVELNLRLGQEQQAMAELDNFISHLASSNQDEKAQQLLENLVDDYPDYISIRRRIAAMYQKLGLTKQAVTHLDAIGEMLLERGDRIEALRTVETIISLNPPNKAAYQKLLDKLQSG